jgi:hypothetical protein
VLQRQQMSDRPCVQTAAYSREAQVCKPAHSALVLLTTNHQLADNYHTVVTAKKAAVACLPSSSTAVAANLQDTSPGRL